MTPWTTSLGSPSSTTGACETYKHWKAPLEWGRNTVRTSPTVSAHGSPRWMRSTRSRVSKARFVSTEKSVRTHALKTSSTHQKNWSHTSQSSTVYNREISSVPELWASAAESKLAASLSPETSSSETSKVSEPCATRLQQPKKSHRGGQNHAHTHLKTRRINHGKSSCTTRRHRT